MKAIDLLLEKTCDYYILVDTQGIVKNVSPSLLEHLKAKREHIIGSNIEKLIQSDELPERIVSKLLRSEDSANFAQISIKTSKKTENCFKLTCTPLDNLYLIQLHDLSEAKFLKKMLSEIEETAKIGYWVVEPGATSPWWSHGTYSIHAAQDHEKFDINGAIDFYVGSSKDQIVADFTQCVLEGTSFDGTYRFKDADGTLKWVRSVGQAERVPGKEGRRIFGVFQDITKSVLRQEELNAFQQRLSLALASSRMGVWEYRLRTNEVIWDNQMYQIYSVDQSSSSNYELWISRVHPEDREEAEQSLRKSVETLDDFNHKFRIVRSDGSIRFIQASARVLVNVRGRATKLIGLNWDITDSIEQERELIKAKESAERAAQTKSNFLSNMSHEIRTPMNGMLGYLELLGETELDEEQQYYVDMIMKSGKSLLTIINDILDYSKIESGHLHIKPVYGDLEEVVNEIKDMFHPMLRQKKLEFSVHQNFSKDHFYHLDFVRIKQILTNLVSNAIKYTWKGSISLTIHSDEQQGFVFFAVEDTGIGISPEIQESLFQPFERDEDKVKFIEGTGLGLSIVKKLLDLMGGNIQCRSVEDEGSKFTVIVPSHCKVKASAS